MLLNQTNLIAHLDTPILPSQNLIYCATFQIVWNQLADEIIKEPIALLENPLTAQVLNKRLFEKHELDEKNYLAMVGFGKDDIVEKIKRGLKEKFKRETKLDLKADALDILSYAYLEKNLPFDTAFDVIDEPLRFAADTPVQSFGIWDGDAAKDQVVVLDYTNPDDFIIKLQASPKVDKALAAGTPIQHARITDEIILAKVSPAATLLETVDAVFARTGADNFKKARQAGDEEKIHLLMPFLDSTAKEKLQIPKIDFDLLQHFGELEGMHFSNPGFSSYIIGQAIQAVKFQLDETGAKLSAEGFLEGHFGVSESDPRRFIFDKPFLLCLREKGAQHPYLVLWVDNSDLLVKA